MYEMRMSCAFLKVLRVHSIHTSKRPDDLLSTAIINNKTTPPTRKLNLTPPWSGPLPSIATCFIFHLASEKGLTRFFRNLFECTPDHERYWWRASLVNSTPFSLTLICLIVLLRVKRAYRLLFKRRLFDGLAYIAIDCRLHPWCTVFACWLGNKSCLYSNACSLEHYPTGHR